MSARLVISADEGVCLEVQLGNHPVRIGRQDGSTLRSADRRTSRQHALIRRLDDGGYEVEDLGSFNGTLLNSQPVGRERLKHLDLLVCGGLQIQVLAEPDQPGEQDPRALVDDKDELRAGMRDLIEEAALLRGEVGKARDELGQARDELAAAGRQRDEEHDEATRLREVVAGLRAENAALDQRNQSLGVELRNERSARPGAVAAQELQREKEQAGDLQRQLERQRARVLELEEQQGQFAGREQTLKKEVERLAELNQKREKREGELTAAVRPALLRVGQLTEELERTRKALALAQSDLAALKQA